MFFKLKSRKIKNNIELVSLHIPKTAGTSFRNILKNCYGEESVVRFDIRGKKKKVFIENEEFLKKRISSNIKVIHGHFQYQDLMELINLNENAKLITWVRHPVQRVLSNYFYLQERLREELDEESKGLNILSKMQKSLIEYARYEINRNRMSKFLHGADLETFDFIGITEHFNEDIFQLAEILGIEKPELLKQNKTIIKDKVEPGVLEEIAQLNSRDMDLYQRALEFRQKRIE